MKEITGVHWFTTSTDTLGLVAVKNEVGIRFYIGRGFGVDENEDAQHIADHGAKIDPKEFTNFFFNHLKHETK